MVEVEGVLGIGRELAQEPGLGGLLCRRQPARPRRAEAERDQRSGHDDARIRQGEQIAEIMRPPRKGRRRPRLSARRECGGEGV
jgi:hypothetical protein